MPSTPTWREEKALWAQGYRFIAGVDEVGRGPLAGPVVAAAVVLPMHLDAPWLSLVRDSKRLSARQREYLEPRIFQAAMSVGMGDADSYEIDRFGIVAATRIAMRRAVELVIPAPDVLLVDAMVLDGVGVPCRALVHGDALSVSIAAASIVAKVHRDRIMGSLEQEYPGYGLGVHKGYPTRLHLEALGRLGPSPVHRRYFAPVRRVIDVKDTGGEV